MSKLLFPLRNVPDDEADDIRNLLSDNNLEFYETSAGNWGISSPGIWLKFNEDIEHAKILIEKYQQQRTIEQQQLFKQLKNEGKHKTFVDLFLENPLKFIAYTGIVILILYFSIKPFLTLGQ